MNGMFREELQKTREQEEKRREELQVKMPERSGTVTVRLVPARPLFLVGKGHALNGKNYYCGRDYPGITRQFDALVEEFRESSFVPIHVQGCPACEAWKQGWAVLKENVMDQYQKYSVDNFLRTIKPYYRFYYQCLVRGEEEKGIQVLSAGRQLHERIITGLAAGYPFKLPKKTRWQAFVLWMRSWWGYVEPKPDLLDWRYGADFIIRREMGAGSWDSRFPDYRKSHFDSEPKRAGDLFQIEEWKTKLLNLEECVRKDSFEDIQVALDTYRRAQPAGGYITITGGRGGNG